MRPSQDLGALGAKLNSQAKTNRLPAKLLPVPFPLFDLHLIIYHNIMVYYFPHTSPAEHAVRVLLPICKDTQPV